MPCYHRKAWACLAGAGMHDMQQRHFGHAAGQEEAYLVVASKLCRIHNGISCNIGAQAPPQTTNTFLSVNTSKQYQRILHLPCHRHAQMLGHMGHMPLPPVPCNDGIGGECIRISSWHTSWQLALCLHPHLQQHAEPRLCCTWLLIP